MALNIFHERLAILYEKEQDKNPRCGRKQFAQMCGLTVSLIDNYLSGRGWPTFKNFKSICRNLNVNAGWLIGESNCKYNFETRFAELTKGLNEAQMAAVEEYVAFLKYSAARRRPPQNRPKNIYLPD